MKVHTSYYVECFVKDDIFDDSYLWNVEAQTEQDAREKAIEYTNRRFRREHGTDPGEISITTLYGKSNILKLVVINECMLGYMYNNPGDYILHILTDSLVKGCICHRRTYPVGQQDTVRLATRKDFDEFRIYFSEAYNNTEEYEYHREVL